MVKEVERFPSFLFTHLDDLASLITLIRDCAATSCDFLVLSCDRQEKIIHVKFDVKHLFLPHVDLWDGNKSSITHKTGQDGFKVGLAQSSDDVK